MSALLTSQNDILLTKLLGFYYENNNPKVSDKVYDELIICRDRFGKKPFIYTNILF